MLQSHAGREKRVARRGEGDPPVCRPDLLADGLHHDRTVRLAAGQGHAQADFAAQPGPAFCTARMCTRPAPARCVLDALSVVPPERWRTVRDRDEAGPESGRSYDRLFADLHAPVFRYVHRLTGDPDLAADITQEAFVRLFQRDGLPEEVRPWLFRVAGNLVRDGARRRATAVRFRHAGLRVVADVPDRPDEAVERAERVASVREVLARVRPRDRKILLMREEGFSYEEIAKAIGVGRRSVPTLVMRALRRFREAAETGDET